MGHFAATPVHRDLRDHGTQSTRRGRSHLRASEGQRLPGRAIPRHGLGRLARRGQHGVTRTQVERLGGKVERLGGKAVWALMPGRPQRDSRLPPKPRSVLVVVALVGGVPVPVVDVVQMVAVEDGGVAASLTVHVDVLLGRLVHR